jgi:HEPN domain-containing protein
MKRFEDPKLLAGHGAFVGDVTLPDMLHAAVLRSPYAHARLAAVDVSAARDLPGVVAVLTGADIAGILPDIPTRATERERAVDALHVPEHPLLATDKVCYVGQAVAMVVAECRAWLGRAWADLDSAAILLAWNRPRSDTALFRCQQTVEKAWKAFLFWHDVSFRKTHNLRELGDACARVDGSLESHAERAEDVTQFAWVFRHPGEPEDPPRQEAEKALDLAREVYDPILARLPEEVQP